VTERAQVETGLAREPKDDGLLDPKPGDEGFVYRLGRRHYAVWTEAMVEAIDRYRKSGRKWFALYDKVYQRENLAEAAARALDKGGAPGVDGVTVERYGLNLAQELATLERQLRTKTYEPHAVRRVYIPKRPGGKPERPLGIPTVGTDCTIF